MSSQVLSRWSRALVAAGAVWFALAAAASVAGAGRRTVVPLVLYGFVFHTVFGKAYSLVPSYFDREIAFPRAPAVHLPASALGTAGLAGASLLDGPVRTPAGGGVLLPAPTTAEALASAGAALWALGLLVFVGSLGWTIRDNPTGAETGTGEAKADRRGVDRAANAVVPVAMAYLLVGSYELLARETALPALLSGTHAGVSHLLAAGGAALVLFGVGFRLLPRFTVAHPPRALVWTVLPAGAIGPVLLAAGVEGRVSLLAGAAVEGLAVVGFAVATWWLVLRSDRDRVGFYGVLASGAAGVVAVGLGGWFAVVGPLPDAVAVHYRANLFGFLGLAIVGVAYQFYPPAVGRFPGADDRTALAAILAIGGGLALEVLALVAGRPGIGVAGRWVTLAGALVHAGLLVGLFVDRYSR